MIVRSSTPWLPRVFLTIVVESKTKGTAPNLIPEVEQMSCTLTQIACVLGRSTADLKAGPLYPAQQVDNDHQSENVKTYLGLTSERVHCNVGSRKLPAPEISSMPRVKLPGPTKGSSSLKTLPERVTDSC